MNRKISLPASGCHIISHIWYSTFPKIAGIIIIQNHGIFSCFYLLNGILEKSRLRRTFAGISYDWQETRCERKETSLRVIYCFDHLYICSWSFAMAFHPASAPKALCCRGCSRRMLLPDSQQAGRGIPGYAGSY